MNRVLEVVLTGNNSSLRGVLTQSAAEVRRFGREVQDTNSNVASSGRTAELSLKAVAAGGIALAAGLGYAVVKAAEFEAAMRNVNSLAGLSEVGLKSLSAEVLAMSNRLPQSAETLANGLYDVVGSGFEAADALTVLEAAAEAASAGMTTTEVSAGAISAVLNAYGLQASDATDVSDTLFQTVNLGVLSFDELAGSIGDVVGTAAAAKVNIAGVGAAIATMTLTGISGAESATSLNNLLQSMIKPSDALAEAFQELGYQSGAQALEQDGLRGVMQKLQGAYGDNVTALLQLFPNIRAARGALALMSNEGANYARVSADLEDKEARQGATSRVLAEQMKATSAQFQILRNHIENGAIAVGTKLLPALNWLMTGFQTVQDRIGDVVHEVADRLGPAWNGLTEIGKLVYTVLHTIFEYGGDVVAVMAKLGGAAVIGALNLILAPLGAIAEFLGNNEVAMWAVVGVLAILALSTDVATASFWRFIGAPVVVFLTNLIGWIGTAITSLGSMSAAAGIARTALVKLGTATVLLGVIAGIVTATQELFSFGSEGDDAREHVAALNREIDKTKNGSAHFKANQDAIADMSEKLKQAQRDWDAYNNQNWFDKWIWQNPFGDDFRDKADAGKDAIGIYQKAIDEAQESNRRYSATLQEVANDLGMSQEKVQELADKYGIDLTEGAGKAEFQLKNFQRIANENTGTGAEQQLIDALGQIADGSSDAEERIKALKDALDALGGKTVDVYTAQAKFQETVDGAVKSLEGLNGEILTGDGHLNAYSERGRAVGDVLVNLRDQANDVVTAMAEQGYTADEIAVKDAELRDSFVKTAESMGVSADQANALADEIYGIPEQRKTYIDAAVGQAAAAIAGIQQQLNNLKSKTIEVGVIVTSSGTQKITATVDENGVFIRRGAAAFTGGLRGVAFAEGGTHGLGLTSMQTGGRLPTTAGIAADGADLVQWAEPGTGGEAFVPLGDRTAPRSRELVQWLYGYFFPEAARAFASGGFTASPSGYTSAVPSSATSTSFDVSAPVEANVRVFLGDRELTDVVKVTVDSRLKQTARSARAAGAR